MKTRRQKPGAQGRQQDNNRVLKEDNEKIMRIALTMGVKEINYGRMTRIGHRVSHIDTRMTSVLKPKQRAKYGK